MTVSDTPEEFQDQTLVPDGVISRGEVHQYNARLVAFFETFFDVICQLHNLVDGAASAAEACLLVG